jgi:hypothetical protein
MYEYQTEDGEVVTHICSWKDKPKAITLADGRVARSIISSPNVIGTTQSGWPYYCDGSAVHPSQSKELGNFLRDAGVPTEVKDGRPKYENMHHQQKALAARGMVDLDSN